MRRSSALLAIAFVFGAGVLVGTRFPDARNGDSPEASATIPIRESSGAATVPASAGERVSDRLQLSQSSTVSTSYASSEALADPRARAALEKSLREVPYAVLKQIFLERQDAQWLRQQERYAQPKDLTDEELERRSERLAESFQRNSNGAAYYLSRGELRLRGGKSLPYVELVEYYGSKGTDGASSSRAKDLCYSATLYLRVGDRYSADALSNCLSWVPLRNQHPFALHANYNSKRLVPYFDTVSVALPGFGTETDVNSEWYDAGTDRWASIGKLRWDSISKDEFAAISKESQLETDGD